MDDEGKARLIDLSIALDANPAAPKGRNGFWGTVNYVHDDIFQYYLNHEWNESSYSAFDNAGLFFTMAVLVMKGEVSWTSIARFSKALKDSRDKG